MFKDFKEFNLPQVEEKVLADWKETLVFQRLQERKGDKGTFSFYEGPPYANGRPGIHHVLSRIFKDIVLRYKAMSGYSVPRRAGWDTHGLPIEIQVEKELGIKNKKEIEKLGISLFNKKAREMIWRYLDEWERFTERIGYWLDLKNPYITCDSSYIESLWWVFKRAYERGYLQEARKIVPYCPRCETPLSSHELGQPGVYKLVKDPSVYIKFKLKGKKNEYLLVWTTTPWTLPSNFAVAVDSRLTYTKYKVGNDYLWSYSEPPKLSGAIEVAEKISGKKMIGWEYEPLYKTLPNEADKLTKLKSYKVVAADFVKTEESTGMVHISPAFGEDDFNLLGKVDFPITIDRHGKVVKGLPGAGKFIKDADKDISADLARRGFLYFEDKIEHEYPFCWRCSSPLIYFARLSWFFEMSRLRKQLLKENGKINWIPDYIKNGRMGEWLKDAKDWSIARDRYWGTPLPIWRCDDCKAIKVVGSLDELHKNGYHQNRFFILRHGEAEHNLKNLIASGPEKGKYISHITAVGKSQALIAARRLKNKKIDVIFTSPYKRAMETAKIVAKELGATLIIDKRLREVDCGTFNWLKVSEHKKFFENPLDKFTKAPPTGETLNETRERVLSFIKDINIRYEGKGILIVGHGDPLWMLEAVVHNVSREDSLKLPYIKVGELRKISFKNLPYDDEGIVDVHRPYIDSVYLKCGKCGGSMKRVPDVADVWFDSGAMPFASVHYPFANAQGQKSKVPPKARLAKGGKSQKFTELPKNYPADYICEGIDQTRGWFYTLLAVAVLLGKEAPYKNVISLGMIRDKNGQKMSKSKGNVVDPWAIMDKYGVDTVRWYFYTVNPPADFKDFDEQELIKTLRKFFLVLYNSYVFYESADIPGSVPVKPNVMDSWMLARLHKTIEGVTANLEKYEIGGAARLIEELTDDLSRWYIRRSRRRPGMKRILGEVLAEISKLTAPFAPFFADALYRSLKNKESVHLAPWPKADKKFINKELLETMEEVRALATLALAKRGEVGIKVRQPFASLKIKNQKSKIKNDEGLLKILADEVNVKEIIFDEKIENEVELDTYITPELKEEGIVREFTRLVQDLRKHANLKPKDKIVLFIELTGQSFVALNKHAKSFSKEVGAATVEFKHTDKFDAEWNGRVDASPVWIGIRKI